MSVSRLNPKLAGAKSKWCDLQTSQTSRHLFCVELPDELSTRFGGRDVIAIESPFDVVKLDDNFHYLVIADDNLAAATGGYVLDVATACLRFRYQSVVHYLGDDYLRLKERLYQHCVLDVNSGEPSTERELLRICSLTIVVRAASLMTRAVLVVHSDKDGIRWNLPGVISNVEISSNVIVTVSYRVNTAKREISCKISRSAKELNQYGVYFRYEWGLPAGIVPKPPVEVDIMDFDDRAQTGRTFIPGF